MLPGSADCMQVTLKFEFCMPTTVVVFICKEKKSLSMQVLANNIFGLIWWLCKEWMASLLNKLINSFMYFWVKVKCRSKSSWVLPTLWRSLNFWVIKLFISVRIEFAYSRAECVPNRDKVVWRCPLFWRSRMLFVVLGCNTSLVMNCGNIGEP